MGHPRAALADSAGGHAAQIDKNLQTVDFSNEQSVFIGGRDHFLE
jgi:hypothetical protein